MTRIPRQHALDVVCADPQMSAEVDAEWVDDPTEPVGDRIRRMDELCVVVARRHGYTFRGDKETN